MAICHIRVQVISRAQGRTAIAAAAYRSATRMTDERLGQVSNFSRKRGVTHSEISIPKNAPDWMGERSRLWNGVEASENRKDAQLAREVQLALPAELSDAEQLTLLRSYVCSQFVDAGMVADWNIHRDNPQNPHAHIMLTMRTVTPEGFGAKDRSWNAKALLLQWREEWSRAVNLALHRAGHAVRIDHRSYETLGIDLEPTPKLDVGRTNDGQTRRDGRASVAERLAEHDRVVRGNGEAILQEPDIALHGITHQRASFSRHELGRYLHTFTADAEQFTACLQAVMQAPQLVALPHAPHELPRFTTQDMLAHEQGLLTHASQLVAQREHTLAAEHVAMALAPLEDGQAKEAAAAILLNPRGLVTLQGFAGTGKSRVLARLHKGYAAGGYRVVGAALSGQAAEGLEAVSGIASRSLAGWETAWKHGHATLQAGDVLVIDEAGMVGTRQMHRVLHAASQAQAKVVLVGDTQQLQAIEAGAPMRLLAERFGALSLTEIHRQRDQAHKQASQHLARADVAQALDVYRQQGCLSEHATRHDAMAAMVEAWDANRRAHPDQTQAMLAFRRSEVACLNGMARDKRIATGELRGATFAVSASRGTRPMACGERVTFLRNDRQLGVKNGTLGTIERLDDTSMQVRLDGPKERTVVFATADYAHLDYGYAATVHKAQGLTVERAQVLATPHFDQHMTYVALTRHRQDVQLHYGADDFASLRELERALGRARAKDMGVDYVEAEWRNRALASRQRKQVRKARARRRADAPATDRHRPQAPALAAHAAGAPDLSTPQGWTVWRDCQQRMAAYKDDQRKLQAMRAQHDSEPLALAQARADLPEVQRAARQLEDAKTSLQWTKDAVARQQALEAAYAQAHPWRTALGLEHDRAAWQATREHLTQAYHLKQANCAGARERVESLGSDARLEACAQDLVAQDKARREHQQARQVALQDKLTRQSPGHAQDAAMAQAVAQERVHRQKRAGAYMELEHALARAQRTAGQAPITPEQAFEALRPVEQVKQAQRIAQIGRDQSVRALADHQKRMADFKREHAIQALWGASYSSDAKQIGRTLQAVAQAREGEVQACARKLENLQRDPTLLAQANAQAKAHNEAIEQAKQKLPLLRRAVQERAPQQQRDLQVAKHERARQHERGRDFGLDR